MNIKKNSAHKIGIIFIVFQITLIIYAQFIPERFFCWAPYDEHTYLETQVIIDGRNLSNEEINMRYNYRLKAWEPRSINNIFNMIEQYEKTYGKNDNAYIYITYSTNGHMQKNWFYNNLKEKRN